MVRVGLRRAEGAEQPVELLGSVVGHPDREVRPAERRQQLELCLSQLTRPGEVDSSVGGEALEEAFE